MKGIFFDEPDEEIGSSLLVTVYERAGCFSSRVGGNLGSAGNTIGLEFRPYRRPPERERDRER